MRLSELQALSESATGYHGGPAVDQLPHLSLEEAASQLPVVIMETGRGFNENREKISDSLNEAAINMIRYGSEPDYNAIVEMSFNDLKTKVKAFFDKIVKFVQSIIAKLKVQIDKIRMTGHQLYDKYKNDPAYRDKEPKDLTVNGYKFEKGDSPLGTADTYAGLDGAKKLVEIGVGSSDLTPDKMSAALLSIVKDASVSDDDLSGKMSDKINTLNDRSKDERVLAMVEAVVGNGFTLHKGSWASDLKTGLYGEKVDIKYGTAPFTKSWIAALLKDSAALEKIAERYTKIKDGAEKFKQELTKDIDDIEKAKSKNVKSGGDDPDSDSYKAASRVNSGMTVLTQYINSYMQVVTDAYNAMTTVSNIDVQYQKDRIAQAKTFFGKILSASAKKENSDASGVEEFEDFNVIV